MTMTARIVNAGNRTGDVLTIERVDPDGNVLYRDPAERIPFRRSIGRGEAPQLDEYLGYSVDQAPLVRIYVEPNVHEDVYIGEPQVVIVDPPTQRRT